MRSLLTRLRSLFHTAGGAVGRPLRSSGPAPAESPEAARQRSRRVPVIVANITRRGSILDCGSGGARHTTFDQVCASGEYDTIVGVDAHLPNVLERREWAAKRPDAARFTFVHADIRDYQPDRRFDVVLLSHVLEHVELDQADRLLERLWNSCGQQMIVETPNEFEDGRNAVAEYGNPYQRHLSLVTEGFMTARGFVRVFVYSQVSGYSNSIYKKERVR